MDGGVDDALGPKWNEVANWLVDLGPELGGSVGGELDAELTLTRGRPVEGLERGGTAGVL